MTYPQLKDWPAPERIENIARNGATGDHYKGTCPKCQGRKLVKKGVDKGLQRYECKFCLHKFRYNGV